MLCTCSFGCFQIYQNKSAKNIAVHFIGTIVPIKCMPKISAVGHLCLDKFENNQTRTCTTFFRTSKLNKVYFSNIWDNSEIQVILIKICFKTFFHTFQKDHATLLLCQDVFNDTLTYLVGIVSNGPDFCGFHEMPALFTNVVKHYKWIDSIIDPNFFGRKSFSEKLFAYHYF